METPIPFVKDAESYLYPEGIDLSDSYILDWHHKDESFEILLELSVWPKSPHYEKPGKDERTCFKKGWLRFEEIQSIKGYVDLQCVAPSLGPNGEKDWDGLYELREVGKALHFFTDFTEIEIECKNFSLRIGESEI